MDTVAVVELLTILAVGLATPGPNALTCFGHSGVYGVKSNVKLILGMLAGISILMLSIGLAIDSLMEHTIAMIAFHWIGMVFLGFMIYGMFQIDPSSINASGVDGALGIKTGVVKQFANGKEWAFIIIIMSQFIQPLGGGISGILVIISITLTVCLAAMAMWTLVGSKLNNTFSDEVMGKRIFTICGFLLGLLMVGFLIKGPVTV